MDKPKYIVDVAKGNKSPLEAFDVLTKLSPEQGLHKSKKYRPPKALYSTSISRISDRVIKCSEAYEKYFNYLKSGEKLEVNVLSKESVDSLEQALYAAAEHVDDLKRIAQGFFEIPFKAESYKKFVNEIDDHRDFITKCVNQIKHHQGRLRGVVIELIYGDEQVNLHGVFVEGISNGVVGPNKTVHTETVKVMSATSILWEIICFLLRASRTLRDVIVRETNINAETKTKTSDSDKFREAIVKTTKLPLYTLDDKHPFSESTVSIIASHNNHVDLSSELTGSLHKSWPQDERQPVFLRCEVGYEGDGMTSSFMNVFPSSVGFSHWT